MQREKRNGIFFDFLFFVLLRSPSISFFLRFFLFSLLTCATASAPLVKFPVASKAVFHPNQLIPFITTSLPDLESTMRPPLVVSEGDLAAAAVVVGFFEFLFLSVVEGERRDK